MSVSDSVDREQLVLKLGGNGGRGPVEVVLWHIDETNFDMTTIATEYPGEEIQEINLTKLLWREGYEIVEAI